MPRAGGMEVGSGQSKGSEGGKSTGCVLSLNCRPNQVGLHGFKVVTTSYSRSVWLNFSLIQG